MTNLSPRAKSLLTRIEDRSARVAVIGLGYVGLPLAIAIQSAGFCVVGFDIDPQKAEALKAGRSYLGTVSEESVARAIQNGFAPTSDPAALADAAIVVACVPTPIGKQREPDLSYVVRTTEMVAATLPDGGLYVLESTTYPGTTDEIVAPLFEAAGHTVGQSVFLAYSPEREDPGNAHYDTRSIPKVVAGDGPDADALVRAFYASVVEAVVPVSSTRTAEAVKITENVFRAVNIALVNELKHVFEAMDIDVWEVIEAAKTKPFGYMPFYPGPGLGGHCIPIDPYYLAWKARGVDTPTRFIELAGEINRAMPAHVVERLARALDEAAGKGLKGARILLIGLAYKKNVADVRESPALKLLELLRERGADALYHDPHVGAVPPTREFADLAGQTSRPLDAVEVGRADAVLIATDHDAIDYAALSKARLIVDTRNAMAVRGFKGSHIVKA
ncbi:MAG: nucleotide sugar dehydrogenase [Pseudomonadota bacterium]